MNKTLISLALAGLAALPANAQLNGNGYYRIKNAKTGRYMTLCDNHSRGVNTATTEAETGALETRKNKSDIISDPGSVFYIQNISGKQYNIKAQGADMHSMTDYYINLSASSYVKGAYRAYQTSSGYTLYLADCCTNPFTSNSDNSYVTTDGDKANIKDWEIIPVSTETDNFIGITPNIKAGGKYYASYYTGFAYNLVSSGMKAYYISKVDEQSGVAVYKEITGSVPEKTPVLIECSSPNAEDNKIEPLTNSMKAVSGNKLTGVFFCVGNMWTNHYNSVQFDAATMRTLNAENDKLTLNTAEDLMTSTEICLVPGSNKDKDYVFRNTIPHNTCYLKVAEGTATSMQLMSEEEYTTGINEITADDGLQPANVYNMNGVIVRSNATSTDGLAKGVYLFKGKKVVVK